MAANYHLDPHAILQWPADLYQQYKEWLQGWTRGREIRAGL